MSFEIAWTPTLHAVANGDEQQLADDLRERAEAAMRQAAESIAVVEAVEAQRQAELHFHNLQRAERALNQFAKNAGEKLAVMREAALDSVIQSAANGDKPDFKGLSELAVIESRSRQATRAIERLVERLLPLALWTRLRQESHAAITLARALETVAQERAERVLDQLREAVGEEMILPVDLSKGVAGALLARADELKQRGMQLSSNADSIEKSLGGKT
ncbi:MAG: hypothetical protein ABI833_20495 [Acidobacteriota bacterium]